MSEHMQQQLSESTVKFQAKGLEWYAEEEKYREVIMEQLRFQEMLIFSCTMDVCTRFGISPDIYGASCEAHIADPSVRAALESMATEAPLMQGKLPASFTRDKLREVLTASCHFTSQYLDEHPDLTPADTMILKARDSDQVLKKFGYTETQVAAALEKYQLNSDPYWDDIPIVLSGVSPDLMESLCKLAIRFNIVLLGVEQVHLVEY